MSDLALTIIGLIVFVGTVAAAAVYIKSVVVKQQHEELKILADTRGDRIHDLETEVDELRREVAELRGQVAALQAFKASEIADEVVARLNP